MYVCVLVGVFYLKFNALGQLLFLKYTDNKELSIYQLQMRL